MDRSSCNVLEYRHIVEPTKEILVYMNDRRKGIISSLRTRWKKFNDQCMGGIEPNVLITVAGISGSGKSAFVNSLETDLFDLNPKANFVVLSFSFEMISAKNVGRKISYGMQKTTQELYSGTQSNLSDEDYKKAVQIAEKIKEYPIYYVDTPGTVEEIRATIDAFSAESFVKGRWLIIMLDHTLLTRGKSGEEERIVLFNLQRLFMEVKKRNRNTIIQLSQMNRSIETAERISNSQLHFPLRSDLFGADVIYQCSDYVFVLHRPETLGIKAYGPNMWPVTNMIYLHIVKNREGEPKILQFKNNLKFNSIDDAD
jgi:replicative DNA helicase